MNKTAVDWLFDQMPDGYRLTRDGYEAYTIAKEMEEQRMIEFAKHSVKMALESASSNAKLLTISNWGNHESANEYEPSNRIEEKSEIRKNHYGHGDCTYEIIRVSKSSILNSFDMNSITYGGKDA